MGQPEVNFYPNEPLEPGTTEWWLDLIWPLAISGHRRDRWAIKEYLRLLKVRRKELGLDDGAA